MDRTKLKERIRNEALFDLIMDAKQASQYIKDGMVIGTSGFTPSGYPKDVPLALAERVKEEGKPFKVDLYTGASVGSEIDQTWSELGMIGRRLPYQTSNKLRENINNGEADYLDMHLSQAPQYLNFGFIKKVDIAIVEATAITEDGDLIPTTGLGNTATFIDSADKVIVEINMRKPMALEGMADVYMLKNPPHRKPIPIEKTSDRIGTPYMKCGLDKIIAVVITDKQDDTRPFAAVSDAERKISANIIEFLEGEVKAGRLTNELLPLQSGVGSVANAVLYGLEDSEFENLTCYTEVVQDSMLELIKSGKVKIASTASISPSPEGLEEFEKDIDFYKDKIILRPQEISNSPEIIRRLGIIAMNTAIEMDIYGNVNSTHIMGSKMMNGIGGSGDFARNGYLTIFSTPSVAKGGDISAIVPMVSHVDHTEHDVMIMVTEQGYADLRGLSPKERALKIINNCAHPDYKEALMDYYNRANESGAKHTPHILDESLQWHSRFLKTGSMKTPTDK